MSLKDVGDERQGVFGMARPGATICRMFIGGSFPYNHLGLSKASGFNVVRFILIVCQLAQYF